MGIAQATSPTAKMRFAQVKNNVDIKKVQIYQSKIWNFIQKLHTIVLFFEECNKGELPLYDTKECQSNGYTCVHSDGSACCSGRQQETRPCVPCDETRLKKTDGLQYTTPGACDATQGTYCMSISHGIL